MSVITFPRANLRHLIRSDPAASVLKNKPLLAYNTSKHFQQRGFIKRELCAIAPLQNVHRVGLLNLQNKSLLATSNCFTVYRIPLALWTHQQPCGCGTVAPNCKLRKAALFQSGSSNSIQSWDGNSFRQLSLSVLRYADNPGAHRDTTIQRLHDLEDSLRYHGYSTIRIGIIIAFAVGEY